MYRSKSLMSVLVFMLSACGDAPRVDGKVTDLWGRAVDGATVRLEGAREHVLTDSNGAFSFEARTGELRIEAGKDGWIKAGSRVTVTEGADAPASATLELHREPEKPGFYAVNHNKKDYSLLEPVAIEVKGSEIGAHVGINDERDIVLRSDRAIQFVFSSTAKSTELSRLGLQLHRLEFVESDSVTGVLGEEEVAVNLWVAREAVPFDLKGLPSEDDYLIAARGPLSAGTYAFHTEGVLASQSKDALERTPKEQRIAYPFTVK